MGAQECHGIGQIRRHRTVQYSPWSLERWACRREECLKLWLKGNGCRLTEPDGVELNIYENYGLLKASSSPRRGNFLAIWWPTGKAVHLICGPNA